MKFIGIKKGELREIFGLDGKRKLFKEQLQLNFYYFLDWYTGLDGGKIFFLNRSITSGKYNFFFFRKVI